MKTIKKLQKPIDKDIHLKYRCKKCGIDHWLSFKEASTKNFIVVCQCGHTFKVKQVKGCTLKFKNKSKPVVQQSVETVIKTADTPVFSNVTNTPVQSQPVQQNMTIPGDLLDKAVKLLLSYGFTKTEATKLVIETYRNVPVNDYGTLVKYTLQSIGDDDGIHNSSTL